jgi:hypothetical protein
MKVLEALDGSNPLGFLAAVGVLNALTDRGSLRQPPRLSWRTGDWRAVLDVDHEVSDAALIDLLLADRDACRAEPTLDLKYQKAKNAGKAGPVSWDLKPPARKYREYLEGLLRGASLKNRRAVDYGAAFATEIARDNNDNTKPTALHFTAGQQEFLRMVADLAAGVTGDDLREALCEPWRYNRDLPVLGWDCTRGRDYALRAGDPSKEKRMGVPGADWLAFRALPLIRVAPYRRQILTTGCSGGWKTGRFTWALWSAPLERDTIQVVLQQAKLSEMDEVARRARGISSVFSSAIKRSDQGGYGSFSPSAVV